MTNIRNRTGWTRLVCGLAAASLIAAACGSDEPSTSPSATAGETAPPTAATDGASQSTTASTADSSTETTGAAAPGEDSAAAIIDAALKTGQAQVDGDMPVDEELALKCWKENSCETGHGTLTVALADGFGENVWRQFTHMEFVLAALANPDVKKIIYTTAHANTQEAIANIQSMIAQKVDVLLTFADSGDALLPAVQDAKDAGITVVPYVSGPGGKAPDDYVTLVGEDFCDVGKVGAQKILDELGPEGGNVLLLGGTPGNNLSPAWQGCSSEVLKTNPNITILGPSDANWTQEGTLTAVSAALAQYGKVDAIQYEYANGALGAVRAFQQADQPLPLMVLQTEDNGLFGEWVKLSPDNPTFKIAYTSGRNWSVRVAFEAAIDARNGDTVPDRITYALPIIDLDASQYFPDLIGEYPATSLVPQSLVNKMFS